ncbi:dihydrofolate reductase family protein [Agromyces sp. NPDC058484]|uniref:dihydrofolate reductase family protein n=1 Tax=Agromyces sp. NPDC058484 TaxID=3346524 RepID=UPI003665EAFE
MFELWLDHRSNLRRGLARAMRRPSSATEGSEHDEQRDRRCRTDGPSLLRSGRGRRRMGRCRPGRHGASAAQQCLAAGLMDEVQIHLAPVLLGDGTRLFEHLGGPIALERTDAVATPNATHLRFRVLTREGDT